MRCRVACERRASPSAEVTRDSVPLDTRAAAWCLRCHGHLPWLALEPGGLQGCRGVEGCTLPSPPQSSPHPSTPLYPSAGLHGVLAKELLVGV
jgi:hypothetical protein